jgi:excisionase family DNA binding protein
MTLPHLAGILLRHFAAASEAARVDLERAEKDGAAREEQDEILDSVQMSKRLKVTDSTIRRWVDDKKIPGRRLGNHVYISWRQFVAAIEAEDAQPIIRSRGGERRTVA